MDAETSEHRCECIALTRLADIVLVAMTISVVPSLVCWAGWAASHCINCVSLEAIIQGRHDVAPISRPASRAR